MTSHEMLEVLSCDLVRCFKEFGLPHRGIGLVEEDTGHALWIGQICRVTADSTVPGKPYAVSFSGPKSEVRHLDRVGATRSLVLDVVTRRLDTLLTYRAG